MSDTPKHSASGGPLTHDRTWVISRRPRLAEAKRGWDPFRDPSTGPPDQGPEVPGQGPQGQDPPVQGPEGGQNPHRSDPTIEGQGPAQIAWG